MKPAIAIENLSKVYRLGGRAAGYQTLRESLATASSTAWGRTGQFLRPRSNRGNTVAKADSRANELWALTDVSFTVRPGEVVGVIGRNGAGKSTLLKILSRITEPTGGRAVVRGRLSSLLEVGTGFHPELTGRENIALNGSILGMSRREIARAFDAIVEFSEIARFLDTPVKRYSSGMYVRLAFAVAAHLSPEILIVDEVLAVGDIQFQQKCLGKMQEVGREGRTVLFVSHNLGAVQRLCSRAVLLTRGLVEVDGPAQSVVNTYLSQTRSADTTAVGSRNDRGGKGAVRLTGLDLLNADGQPTRIIPSGGAITIRFQVNQPCAGVSCGFTVYDEQHGPIVNFSSNNRCPLDGSTDDPVAFECTVDPLLLRPGRYYLNVALQSDRGLQDHLERALVFQVEQGHLSGRPVNRDGFGPVVLPHRWAVPPKHPC